MSGLNTDPNIAGVDDVDERLIAILDGESVENSLKVALRLNLILMNHVGEDAEAGHHRQFFSRPQ